MCEYVPWISREGGGLGGGGDAMVGVGFFGIDNEVWDVHLGEDIVDVFGLWE